MKRSLLFFALLVAACGSSTPTPAETGDVTGTWAGSYTSAILGSGQATLSLAQSGSSVSGTWTTSSAGGTNSGTVNTTNSTRGNVGSFTADLLPSDPTTCPFRATLNFNITAGTMVGSFVTVNCTVAASGNLSLTRR